MAFKLFGYSWLKLGMRGVALTVLGMAWAALTALVTVPLTLSGANGPLAAIVGVVVLIVSVFFTGLAASLVVEKWVR